jgi:penicillin-binding protein 1A
MNDPFSQKSKPKNKPSPLLGFDAWLDTALYEAGFRAREIWETVTIFSRRFHVSGWRRGLFELAGEGMTLGTLGFTALLTLAQPSFEETRGDWRKQDAIAVTFLDRYGNEIGQRGIIHKDAVPIDELPDHVIKAVLATEDRRFFEHVGLDFLGLARAMSENVRANSVVQGGSTITQQLAKNIFLTNERTLQRKVKEAFLSIWLEANLSKKEILQLYLDRAYMGGGTFGIAAASNFYFGKSVKDVSLAEAAMLAGLFKAPAKYAPHINLPAARARANEVLTNMVQGGLMSEGQVLDARRHPANIVERTASETPDYFLDWAFEEVKKTAKGLPQTSFVVRTTVDLDLQKAAEESVEFHLRQNGQQFKVTQAAVVMIENDGAVRAMVGGRDYGVSQFNRATGALRQAGSSFKPYVYATAMENGFTPESVVPDSPISWGTWSPQNYNRGYAGRINLTTALVKSINTVPVRLTKEHLTTKPIAALAKAMGVESVLSTHKTMCLGTSGMTVLDQATGYLTFANGGFAHTRHAFTQILTYSGDVIWDYQRDAEKPARVLSEQADTSMNTILAQVPEWGTGRRAELANTRVAGKTGTTQSYRDAWFVGFTGNYTAAVWYGNDDFSPTEKMTGGILPAMTFQRFMEFAHQNIDLKPIPGLEKPFPDEKPKPKEKLIAKEDAAEPLPAPPKRPAALTSRTTAVLKSLNALFNEAPSLAAADL